ncbi:MAG: hypothetical protein Q9219_003710 [cf. Caloplaca sp. 3 TL-2023]
MAEIIAAISFASAVINLVDIGGKVLSRLHEFHETSQEIPESFRHLDAQLPIVFDGLRRTEARARAGNVDQRTLEALIPTIQGCRDRVGELYEILDSVLPSKSDSTVERAFKAARSLSKDRKVQKLLKDVDSYLMSLTFHNTSGDTAPSHLPLPVRCVNMTPADRDKNFVDRPDVFYALDATMKEYGRAAVTGIGGVGKTQIAVEQCYRFRERDSASNILWLHATSISKLVQSCKDISEKLKLPGWNDPQSDTLRIFHAWLSDEHNGNWMLVLDNVDDTEVLEQALPTDNGPKSLLQLVPHRHHGKLLVTTRDRRVGERLAVRGRTVTVPPMSLSEGRTLLVSYLPSARDYVKVGLDELVGTLDCLPLAITQAAAYMTENYMDVTEYIGLLEEGGEEMEALLSESFSDNRRGEAADNSVLKTWKLSFDQITSRFSRAADMLALMAMFDRQGVPEDLLRYQGEPKIVFNKALGMLQSFSLIGKTMSGGTYNMHRLVQIAVRTWLQLTGSLMKWKEQATHVLSARFPSGDFETWSICEPLVPHVRVVLDLGPLPLETLVERAELLKKVAWFDRRQDRWLLANTRAREAASLFAQILGPEAPKVLSCKVDTADALIELEKPREAEQLLIDILPLMERVYGSKHPETLRNLGNQGWAKFRYGDFENGDTQLRAVARVREEVLGPMHPDTLLALNNVAVNAAQLSWEESEKAVTLGRQVLAARMKIFGPDHIDVLEIQGNLANFLDNVGEYDEAQEYYRRTIAAKDKIYGPGNPWTLTLMHNLAVCYNQQSKYQQAIELDKTVLSSRIQILGEDHIDTIMSRHNLIYDLEEVGQEPEEVALQSRLILNYREAIERSQRPFTRNLVPNAERSLERATKKLATPWTDDPVGAMQSMPHLSIQEKV